MVAGRLEETVVQRPLAPAPDFFARGSPNNGFSCYCKSCEEGGKGTGRAEAAAVFVVVVVAASRFGCPVDNRQEPDS